MAGRRVGTGAVEVGAASVRDFTGEDVAQAVLLDVETAGVTVGVPAGNSPSVLFGTGRSGMPSGVMRAGRQKEGQEREFSHGRKHTLWAVHRQGVC